MAVLLDHFCPPLSLRRHWHTFFYGWATAIAAALNRDLPEGQIAEVNVAYGIDSELLPDAAGIGSGWNPPPPTRTVPLPMLTDAIEVLVFDRSAGPTLVGAVELVSPAKRDRPAYRDAFVTKCEDMLHQGIGLIVVDVVTDTGRRTNLHVDLLARLGATSLCAEGAEIYAIAYRPIIRQGEGTLEIWEEPLALGQPLPTLPLGLSGSQCLPVDLDASYARTCSEQRIPAGGA